MVTFSAAEAVLLPTILPELATLGFELSDLGQNSFGINGVPAGIEGLNPVRLLTDMVSRVVETGNTGVDQVKHSLALSLARQSAIPEGQLLDNQEMESVINGLFACSNVNHTPDGKKILYILPQRDLEKMLD